MIEEDPYEVLGVERNITKEDLKKRFTKLQLKYHPDRKTGNKDIYLKVVKAYKSLNQDIASGELFQMMENFKNNYVGSEEEKEDLIKLYKRYSGSMKEIIETHLCCEGEDEPRLRQILDELIEKRILRKYKIYDKILYNNKKILKTRYTERLEVEKMNLESLQSAFLESERKRRSWLQDLETRYTLVLEGKQEKKKTKGCKQKKRK